MVTILLEQIIELLKGFIDSFKDHAAEVAEKLGLISEDTSDINDNTDTIVSLDSDIKDNTDILVANTGAIKNSSQATSTNTAAIASDTTVIRNNINTISVNSGKTAAFTEDTASNTLNTLNKVTTIASDTTQIRHIDTNIYARLNSMYNQLDWLLYGVDFINTISGSSPIIFNTDKGFIPLKSLIAEIKAIQTGSGNPSPSNIRPIGGFNSANLNVNNESITIPLGQTVYGGSIDITKGKLKITQIAHVFDGSESFVSVQSETVFAYNMGSPIVGSFGQNNSLSSHFTNETSGGGWNFLQPNHYLIAGSYYAGVNPNMSLSDYKDYLQAQYNNDTPVCIVATLITPIELDITSHSVDQIEGANTISCNTNGNITLSYTESVKNHINS